MLLCSLLLDVIIHGCSTYDGVLLKYFYGSALDVFCKRSYDWLADNDSGSRARSINGINDFMAIK